MRMAAHEHTAVRSDTQSQFSVMTQDETKQDAARTTKEWIRKHKIDQMLALDVYEHGRSSERAFRSARNAPSNWKYLPSILSWPRHAVEKLYG